MRRTFFLALAFPFVVACGAPGETAGERECREAVKERAAQGEYGNQADAVFKDNVREAYEDCTS